jgi:hypothetical protein
VSDIAEKLLAHLDKIEQAGRFGPAPLAYVVDGGRGNYFKPEDISLVYHTGEGTERDAVLRHCAAHRETVELYVKVKKDHDRLEQRLFAEPSIPESDRKDLLHCKEVLPYLHAVLSALARGYGLEETP